MKYFLLILAFVLVSDISFASNIQEWLLKTWTNGVLETAPESAQVWGVLKFIKDTIVGIVPLIVIGTFLFIGGKLFMAKGNPEEFKKALMHLVYVVIGMFFIAAAWAIISIISWVTL